MSVVLNITSGRDQRRSLRVRHGELVRVGKGELADIRFPNDGAMADVHFELDYANFACTIRSITQDVKVFVNEHDVDELVLSSGDRIVAGNTTIEVVIDERLVSDDQPSVVDPAETISDSEPSSPHQLSLYLEFEENAQRLAEESADVDEFLTHLVNAEDFASAIRVRAHLMDTVEAVKWAWDCLRSLDVDWARHELELLESVERWLSEPNDENRRAAHLAAEAANFEGPGSWLAMAAYWAEGSMAPPDRDEVFPDERMSGNAIKAALVMAAVFQQPEESKSRYETFLRAAASTDSSS